MTTLITPRTHDKTMPLADLMALVDAGDWDAKAILATRIFFGNEVAPDPGQAIQLLQEAAAAGSVRATAELAFRYLDHEGPLPRDTKKSRAYADLAIERGNYFGWWAHLIRAEMEGDLQSAFEAGCQFAELAPEEDRAPENIYVIGWLAHHLGEDDAAREFYIESAAGGHPPAAINLALLVLQGRCNLTSAQVLELFRQAAIQHSPAGVALFTQFLCFRSDSTPAARPDLVADAVAYLRQTMEQTDYHYAPYMLGRMYDQGFGVTADQVEATRLFRIAAEQEKAGDGPPYVQPIGTASLEYARRLRVGLGCDTDLEQAMTYCERACDNAMSLIDDSMLGPQDVIDGATLMALEIAQESGRYRLQQRSLKLLETGAATGNVDMILPYAKLHLEVFGNFGQMRRWFILALALDQAEAGVIAAAFLLKKKKFGQAYAFAQAAKAAGATLPAELAALSADQRDKKLLSRSGETGADLLIALREEIAVARATYGDDDPDGIPLEKT